MNKFSLPIYVERLEQQTEARKCNQIISVKAKGKTKVPFFQKAKNLNYALAGGRHEQRRRRRLLALSDTQNGAMDQDTDEMVGKTL